jgi:hypothetical protein
MKASDFIGAIKEFFLDFLGFLLPGLIALIILSECIIADCQFGTRTIFISSDWNTVILLIIAYIIGYAIYPLSDITDKILFLKIDSEKKAFGWIKKLQINSPKEIEAKFDSSPEKAAVVNILEKLLVFPSAEVDSEKVFNEQQIASINIHTLRSILMSYCPEADMKIYTFMFRSELCRLISSFALAISIFGIIFYLFGFYFKVPILFRTDMKALSLYVLLLIMSYFLTKTRVRYYSIAFKIPFLIFISKRFKLQ